MPGVDESYPRNVLKLDCTMAGTELLMIKLPTYIEARLGIKPGFEHHCLVYNWRL